MRRPHLLNVKHHLKCTDEVCQIILDADGKYGNNGVMLPPAYRQALAELSLFSRAILRKHAAKAIRKDVYVER